MLLATQISLLVVFEALYIAFVVRLDRPSREALRRRLRAEAARRSAQEQRNRDKRPEDAARYDVPGRVLRVESDDRDRSPAQ